MKLYKYLIIALIALLPLNTLAQGAKGKAALSYEKFFKEGMKKVEGTLPVYMDGDKYYLEIPEQVLGRDVMASGMIADGPWFGTPSIITDVFKFTKGRGDEINILKHNSSDYIDEESGDEGLVNALKASSLQPVDLKYAIVAYSKDKKGCIIDITKDVTANGPIFSFPNLQWVNRPDSRSFLMGAEAVSNGVKFLNKRSQTDFMPDLSMQSPGYDKTNTVVIEWGLQVLPESKMRVRLSDPRVGTHNFSYSDYGVFPYSVRKTTVMRKWNLQPKDVEKYKNGELSEPVNPIVLALDNSVPKLDYPAIERAVAEWNKCFEGAGFKNVIKIKDGKREIFFGHNEITISCTNSILKMNSSTVSDPRTGEYLSGYIHYSGKTIVDIALGDVMLFNVINPKYSSDNHVEEVRLEILRTNFTNTLGQLLGLAPNMAGSFAYTSDQLRDALWVKKNGITASVMDNCLTNYAVQPTDKQFDLTDLYPHVSHYDRWALECIYRIFPDNTDENADKISLKSYVEKANSNPYLLFVAANRGDYRGLSSDLGRDRAKVAELVINNIKLCYPKVSKLAPELFDNETMDFAMGGAFLNSIYTSVINGSKAAIGGITITPVIKGYNDQAIGFAPKSEQQAAIAVVKKYVTCAPQKWNNLPEYVKMSGNSSSIFQNGLANNFIFSCIDPVLIDKLVKTESVVGKNALTSKELFAALNNQLFFDFNTSKTVSSYFRNLQFAYVGAYSSLINQINFAKQSDGTMMALLTNYKDTYKKIKGLSTSHSDAVSRNHFRTLQLLMEREVAAEAKPTTPAVKK